MFSALQMKINKNGIIHLSQLRRKIRKKEHLGKNYVFAG